MSSTQGASSSQSTRERIVAAAMRLLAEGGPERVSTRAVCDAAGVQPPTIYRLFESKDGLLDAVAQEGFLLHQESYGSLTETEDPVEDLRKGWDQHIAFGLSNPYLYSVMYGRAHTADRSPAAVTANGALNHLIHRVAEAGVLLVDEEFAALAMNAAGTGTTLTLIALPEEQRPTDTSHRIREGFIASIIAERREASESGLIGAASAVDALMDASPALLPVERALMHHWLHRLTRPDEHSTTTE